MPLIEIADLGGVMAVGNFNSEKSGLKGVLAARRRLMLLSTALGCGIFAGIVSAPHLARANEECGGIPNTGGSYAVACGQGPFNSGIRYSNGDTDDAGSTIFTFTNTQAFGVNNAIIPILNQNPNAVFLSSNEAGHSITVEVLAIAPGPVPLFDAGNVLLGLGDAQGFVVQTSGATSAISYTVANGTHLGGSSTTGNVNGLVLSTTGATSGITAEISAGTYTGGTSTVLGNANGMTLSTANTTSAISLTMTGTATGGSALLGNANGLTMSTTGADSGVTAALTGSYTGGSSTLGQAHGVVISTTGGNSGVIFSLNGDGSTITGGTSPLAVADGVRITTATADSNITFDQAANTTISANNGNGVSLHATGGGSILANNTINGVVTSNLTVAGVGVGTGFVGTAVGAGTTGIHVGATGNVSGTGAGLIGTAVDGNVTLLNEGQVNQTALVASPLNPLNPASIAYGLPFAYIPVGLGGAATGTGNVDITTTVGSSVSQVGAQAITGIEGVGISAQTFLGSGNATITAAGTVAATGIGLWSNANSGTAVATSNSSVTLVGGAGGPAAFIDPYLIQSGSTVGILAQSVTNSATANLVALNGNPASVGGFDIGLAANVFAGTQNAVVNVDGTNGGATVNANVTGLYSAVSLAGTGNAIINQTNGVTTAPVAAAAVALNAASSVFINNDQNSQLNGAVVAAAGLDATVNNTNNSQINIPALSAQVVVAGRDATVNNNTGSSITLAGPLSFNVMVAGQDATINNANGGTSFTVNGPISANLMFADRDTTINNSNGAQFNLNGPFTASAMIAGQDAIIRNYNGADFNMTGAVDANVMVAQRDAIIENYNGGTFNMNGAFNANMMFAERDAIIRNYNGGEFNVFGAINLNYMNAERDALIENYNGGEFNLFGALNGNVMVADRDATILNYNGGDFTAVGLLNGNLMVAGQDALIQNYNGGEFTIAGIGSGNLMFAGRDATIRNFNGGEFTIVGALNGNVMSAGRDALIENFNGGEFNLIGGGIGNLIVAGRDARIDNSFGGQVNLAGITGSLMIAGTAGGGGNAILNNYSNGEVNFLGGNVLSMIAPDAAIVNNNDVSRMNFVGLNALTIDGGLLSEFNNTANLNGNNNADCIANGLAGVCVTGVAAISGGLLGAPLNFNNAGGLVSMINGSSTVVTDAAAFFGLTGLVYPSYGTGVGDITVIGGNFNGSGNSQLGVDTFVAGNNNSSSDLMIVTGATSGTTNIIVRDLNGGPGSYNTTGIPLVAVTSGVTSPDHFRLDQSSTNYDSRFGGVLDKGLFFYYLTQKGDPVFAGGTDHVLVSAPDQELYELSKAATAAQNIWYETTGTWLERTADLRNFLMARGNMAAGAGADMPVKARPIAPMPTRSITPGVWLKALGSWTDRDSNDTFSGIGRQFGFDTSYKQKTFGLIGGIDGGWDYKDSVFMVGLLGGYIDSKVDFNATSNGLDYKGGTVGAYATYLNRGFFFDTVFKADLLKMSWSAPTLGGFGFSAPESDANSYGVMVDTGYRIFDNGAFFFEPLGSFAWVRTSIDSINVLGTSLNFGDSDSVRGSLGGRLGFASMWGATKVEASITGRVWHEFDDPNPLQVVTSGPLLQIQDQFTGTYGDVNGTLNFIGLTSGWSTFANGGVKFNSDFTTVSAKGGFRYQW